MTPGLSKYIWCYYVWPYSFLGMQITRSDIREHKVGCQPSDGPDGADGPAPSTNLHLLMSYVWEKNR